MSTTTTLPFGGGELCSFDPYDGNCVETTLFGSYDTAWSRCGIGVNGNISGCDSPKWSDTSDFWHQEQLYIDGPNAWYGEVWTLTFQTNGGTQVFRMTTQASGSGASTYRFYSLQSGSLTLVGSFVLNTGTPNKLAIRLKAGAGGVVEVYVSGTQRFSATGLNHAGFAGVGQVSLRGSYALESSPTAVHSQVICDSVNHIGDVLASCPPTGAGANTAWIGAYTDVDEPVYSDADKITSTAANDIETFTTSASYSGTVKAVIVALRANCGATGPQNIQAALRSTSNYFGTSRGLSAGFQAVSHAWATDPNTSAAWVTADALSAQPGAKALA